MNKMHQNLMFERIILWHICQIFRCVAEKKIGISWRKRCFSKSFLSDMHEWCLSEMFAQEGKRTYCSFPAHFAAT